MSTFTTGQLKYDPYCRINIRKLRDIKAICDHGASQLLVPARYINSTDYMPGHCDVVSYDGCQQRQPMASVYIESPFFRGWCDVVVTPADTPTILLGNV